MANSDARPRSVRHAPVCRRAVDARVPDLREHRDDDGHHAHHGHPPSVHVLRRFVDGRFLRRHRPRSERPHEAIRLTSSRRTLDGHMNSLWPRIEPLLAKVQKPARYIGCEDGAQSPVHEAGKVGWLLIYPDAYEI